MEFAFVTKRGGENYANCDGTYVMDDTVILNDMPIYVNRQKHRFAGAHKNGSWCITSLDYLAMILREQKEYFGGFHGSSEGKYPSNARWDQYHVTMVGTRKVQNIDEGRMPRRAADGAVIGVCRDRSVHAMAPNPHKRNGVHEDLLALIERDDGCEVVRGGFVSGNGVINQVSGTINGHKADYSMATYSTGSTIKRAFEGGNVKWHK
jgi:hypothetical protein